MDGHDLQVSGEDHKVDPVLAEQFELAILLRRLSRHLWRQYHLAGGHPIESKLSVRGRI